MKKKLYNGSFVPYRKPKNPKPPVIDVARSELIFCISTELQSIALALDTSPDQGAITMRDSKGVIWEITVQRSDAKWLQGEADMRAHLKETLK